MDAGSKSSVSHLTSENIPKYENIYFSAFNQTPVGLPSLLNDSEATPLLRNSIECTYSDNTTPKPTKLKPMFKGGKNIMIVEDQSKDFTVGEIEADYNELNTNPSKKDIETQQNSFENIEAEYKPRVILTNEPTFVPQIHYEKGMKT